VAAADAATAAAASDSILACADDAGAAMAAEVAAIAAAAIASGAVAVPETGDVEAAAGTSVNATVTGIAMATGPPDGVEAAGSALEVSADDFDGDFASPVFDVPDLAPGSGPVSVLPAALALALLVSEADPALVLRSFRPLFADGSVAAVADDCELSAAAGVSSERRCGGATGRSLLLVSAAVLLSTSDAKLSVDDGPRSGLAGFGNAA
jgi:hypothetical protein